MTFFVCQKDTFFYSETVIALCLVFTKQNTMVGIVSWYQSLTIAKASYDDDDYGEDNDLVENNSKVTSVERYVSRRLDLLLIQYQDLYDLKLLFQSQAETCGGGGGGGGGACRVHDFEKRKASETIRVLETQHERDHHDADGRYSFEELYGTCLIHDESQMNDCTNRLYVKDRYGPRQRQCEGRLQTPTKIHDGKELMERHRLSNSC